MNQKRFVWALGAPLWKLCLMSRGKIGFVSEPPFVFASAEPGWLFKNCAFHAALFSGELTEREKSMT
jgi:hypothetical protein